MYLSVQRSSALMIKHALETVVMKLVSLASQQIVPCTSKESIEFLQALFNRKKIHLIFLTVIKLATTLFFVMYCECIKHLWQFDEVIITGDFFSSFFEFK